MSAPEPPPMGLPKKESGTGILGLAGSFWRGGARSEQPYDPEFARLVERSEEFGKKVGGFPCGNNLVQKLAGTEEEQKKVVCMAENSRPLLHTRLVPLIENLLDIKRTTGTQEEKEVFDGMSVSEWVSRALLKRPLEFMTSSDQYLLQNGMGGAGSWDLVGSGSVDAPVRLADYMCYDEIAVAALLGVSTHTLFINRGHRNNYGAKGAAGTFEQEGFYTALVGARFERHHVMEAQHMLVTPQCSADTGYGSDAEAPPPILTMWARFYGQGHGDRHFLPSFAEAEAEVASGGERFVKLRLMMNAYLNADVYKARMKLSAEIFLIDANDRAASTGQKAYTHAVGLGLGVWKCSPEQPRLYGEAFLEAASTLSLPHVSDIDFSYCDGVKCEDKQIVEDKDGHPITIHLSRRDPAALLSGPDEGKLLVAMYAWDGNSYPGNEYWAGMLAASGDPAAACCSTIQELQNPHINPRICGDYMVECDPGGNHPVRPYQASAL